jgi:hypothetical protein
VQAAGNSIGRDISAVLLKKYLKRGCFFMKVRVVIEIPADEMAEMRECYGEGWTNEQVLFEQIYESADSYLQNIEVKIV